MDHPNIRKASLQDLKHIAEHLREADLIELRSYIGAHADPLKGLSKSARWSHECWVGVSDAGEPAVVFGIGKPKNGQAMIWALATPLITQYPQTFLRGSRYVIDDWFERFGLKAMFNFTHAGNLVHHRWLKWLGANLFPAVPYGKLNEEFLPFSIVR